MNVTEGTVMDLYERPLADEEYLARIAGAACLRLTPEELRQFARQTEAMLCELDRLQDPGPLAEGGGAVRVEALREDVPGCSLGREELLSAAPVQDGVCFTAPPVLKGGEAE